ncbi:hypothetical protein FVE85_6080 [Porphyridium purpureum]|uniref:Uncharacterized protein n=1 Tax=Porphyridium purpureum TaxID=35688 RepID=A0A5J4Z5A3_PORPP|nr:hypothetical protein FVE85_6080 [Porphyridium purpureum]|eukprot:POR7714..scf295_1
MDLEDALQRMDRVLNGFGKRDAEGVGAAASAHRSADFEDTEEHESASSARGRERQDPEVNEAQWELSIESPQKVADAESPFPDSFANVVNALNLARKKVRLAFG